MEMQSTMRTHCSQHGPKYCQMFKQFLVIFCCTFCHGSMSCSTEPESTSSIAAFSSIQLRSCECRAQLRNGEFRFDVLFKPWA
eukprot:4015342-Amphidinium_carterae.1